jgi:alkylation response protein AidB-like acyl-CoA dehydrogenase
MTAVERGRLGVAARSVGVAQSCLDDSVAFANERIAFGSPIASLQIVQSKITDMAVGVRTARLLVKETAEALQTGERSRVLTSMAKMYASDVAFRSAADAVQIHGAAGISPDSRVGRFLRDAKVLQIVEGSNDLHRALIGEMVLGLRKS